MDVAQTTQTTPPVHATQTAQAPQPTSTISSDFETFLRMLTVQLENQDPLNPMSSDEFAVQLATFSGVEQQVLTNDLLADMTAMLSTGSLGDLAAWVGMEVLAPVPVDFDGTPVTLYPPPEAGRGPAELVVLDADGAEVSRQQVDLSEAPFDWAGTAPDGTPLPSGTYSMTFVVGTAELATPHAAHHYLDVAEVRLDPTGAILLTQGGQEIDPDSVAGLRSPGDDA